MGGTPGSWTPAGRHGRASARPAAPPVLVSSTSSTPCASVGAETDGRPGVWSLRPRGRGVFPCDSILKTSWPKAKSTCRLQRCGPGVGALVTRALRSGSPGLTAWPWGAMSSLGSSSRTLRGAGRTQFLTWLIPRVPRFLVGRHPQLCPLPPGLDTWLPYNVAAQLCEAREGIRLWVTKTAVATPSLLSPHPGSEHPCIPRPRPLREAEILEASSGRCPPQKHENSR